MGTHDAVAPRWSTFAIPDSSPDIELARLAVDDDGAFTVLVRFPAGWERPVVGSYDAAEEALVLDGSLVMSGRHHGPGEFVRWGVDYRREGTSSEDGATVLAWFSKPNRWTQGETDVTGLDAAVSWRDVAPEPSRLGPMRPLSDRPEVSVVVLDAPPTDAVAPCELDLFEIEPRRLTRVPAGAPLPDLRGPVLGRLRGGVHELR